jgi:hypothetical protein
MSIRRVPKMEWSLLALTIVALVITGCGGSDGGETGSTALARMDADQLRTMAGLYMSYRDSHRNQSPPDEKAFREYLSTKQDELQRVGLTIDAMFVSPRGNGPIQWVYGMTPPTNKYGMTFLAYETAPVDGNRLAIAIRGQYQVLDESQFREMFPNQP